MKYHCIALLATLAALMGCSSSDGFARVPVKGKVMVDGRPLQAGLVRFVPAPGSTAPVASAVVANGEYTLDATTGPAAGPHRVEIEGTGHWGFAIDDEAAYAQAIRTKGAVPDNPIPPQYNRQSTLTTEIPPEGSEQLDFELVVAAKPVN